MNNVAWIALAVSVVSACFAGVASWTSRERLRLDLYNRRFEVYSRTLDLYHALLEWKPTETERMTTSLRDSPELRTTQRAFIKASREAQFLFKDVSGIKKQLEQIHSDSIRIIGYLRDFLPKLNGRPEFISANQECDECWKRFHEAIPSLEEKMSEYLDFHALLAWR
jgi:hypothetical protein